MENSHKISMFTAILITINIMVGIGVFIVPSLMAQQVGNLSFLGWPLVGIIFLPVVYSIAQITKLFPGQGNFFSYSNKELGKKYGFISGWFYFLGFASVSAIQFIGLKEILSEQFQLYIIKNNSIVFNIILISIFCLLNLLSLTYISKIQNTVTIIKLLPIFFLMSLVFFYWNPNFTLNWGSLSSLKFTLPLTMFGFWGFESSCNISHLIKGNKNTPSKVILISFIGTVVIYTFFHLGALHVMGSQNLIKYQIPGFVNFLNINNKFIFKFLSSLISSTILITFISSIFGGILTNSTNLHSMLENNVFPNSNKLKKLNKNHRPKYAIWLTGIAIFVLMTLIKNKVILNSVCNFGLIVAFVLTLTSLLLIQIRKQLKFQTIPTIIAFISSSIIVYYSWILMGNSNIERFKYLLPLIFFGALGFLLFKFNEQKSSIK